MKLVYRELLGRTMDQGWLDELLQAVSTPATLGHGLTPEDARKARNKAKKARQKEKRK